MPNYYDIDAAVTDFRGVLGWNAFTQPLGTTARPAVEVELFIKEHSIPTRKKKVQDINTISLTEPNSEKEMGTQAIFEGGVEPLQVTLSGWTKTPIVGGYYEPRSLAGTALTGFQAITYTELIGYYIEGRMNQTVGGAYQRRDPDYFISPYGQKYNNPVISIWEPEALVGYPKKHNFTATLLLER